jgi:membrane protease YdiL (CAAX protease family)
VIDNSGQFAPEATPEPVSPPPARYPFWNWEDLVLFIALALPCFLIAVLICKLTFLRIPVLAGNKAMHLLPPEFLGYGLWFLCLWILLKTRYDAPFWASMRWTLHRRQILPALVNGITVGIAIAILGVVLHTPQVDTPMRELMDEPASAALVILFALTLGPVCEELIFRGFLLPLLARTFGRVAAVVLAATAFALLHGPQNAWTWQVILLIGLAGCAFGWMRLATGSTAAAALMHVGYNSLVFVGYVVQKGNSF